MKEYAKYYGPPQKILAVPFLLRQMELDQWSHGRGGRRVLVYVEFMKTFTISCKITQTNPKMAQVIISQFVGPDGELAASMQCYLSQRCNHAVPKEVTRGLFKPMPLAQRNLPTWK